MKSTPRRKFALTATFFLIYTIEAVITIPRSYIVEYAQQDSTSNHHDTINNDLFQYRDLYNIHHTYSSPIFQGMSFSLKDPSPLSVPQHPHQSITPAAYSTITSFDDKIHPVYNHLQNHPAIKSIYPIYEVPRPQWMPNSRNYNYSFPYSNRDSQVGDVHQKLGITGEGILIGVLDSGVDYNHPALGGGFGEGFKVKFGKNLVPASNDEESGVEPLGEDDPYDPCKNNDSGHGTHVSGILVGYDQEKNFIGIAPNASLGMWRIFGCEGGAGEDTVIKAMEMAFEAGCKIINLSLGIENGWPEDAMAVVAENLSKKGVTVVGVAGNQGTDGVYSQNSPASGKNVFSVASVDNSFYPTKVLNVDIIPGGNFPFMLSSSTISFPNGTLASIIENKTIPYGCKNDSDITEKDSKDKILLIKRGQCTFDEKLEFAEAVGAKAVLFYDPDPMSKSLVNAKTKNDSLPCAAIDYRLASQIIDYLKDEGAKAKPIQVTFPPGKKIIFPDTAGVISEFSSTGPTYELDLKPSITGIGGDVYSTLPLHIDNGWGVRSGTSMASPHVAGSAALLTEYYSKQNINVTSNYIMEHLKNHAKMVKSASGAPEHPLVQGAGLIQPLDAIESQIHVSPSQISFNDTTSLTEYKSYSLDIHNSNSYPLLITIENIQSNSIQTYANDTSFVPTEPAIKNGSITVNLQFTPNKDTLLLAPMSTTSVQVNVILPDPNELYYHYQMYGGFISLKNVQTGDSLATVPYFGVLGRMTDLPLFDNGFPYLAPAEKTEVRPANDSTPYRYDLSRKAQTEPAIVLRLLTGSANMEIKVYDVNHKFLGIMSGGPWIYNQRNTLKQENYLSSISWIGKLIPKDNEDDVINYDEATGDKSVQVEDGTYYIHLRALKHFGDQNNDNDWEEWTSGPIIVKS